MSKATRAKQIEKEKKKCPEHELEVSLISNRDNLDNNFNNNLDSNLDSNLEQILRTRPKLLVQSHI